MSDEEMNDIDHRMFLDTLGHHLYAFLRATEELAEQSGEDLLQCRTRLLHYGVQAYEQASPAEMKAAIDESMTAVFARLGMTYRATDH